MEVVNKIINMPIDQWPEYVKVINQIEALLVNTCISRGLLKGFPLNLEEKEMRLSLQFVQSASEVHVRSYLQRQNDSKAWKVLNVSGCDGSKRKEMSACQNVIPGLELQTYD